jgi:hypothetical protein
MRRVVVFVPGDSDDSQIKTICGCNDPLIVHGHGDREKFVVAHDAHEVYILDQDGGIIDHYHRSTNDPKIILAADTSLDIVAKLLKQYPGYTVQCAATSDWYESQKQSGAQIVCFCRDTPPDVLDAMDDTVAVPAMIENVEAVDILEICQIGDDYEIIAAGVIPVYHNSPECKNPYGVKA